MSKSTKIIRIIVLIVIINVGILGFLLKANAVNETTKVYGEIHDLYGNNLKEELSVNFIPVDGEGIRLEGQKNLVYQANKDGTFIFEVPNGYYVMGFTELWRAVTPLKYGLVHLAGEPREFIYQVATFEQLEKEAMNKQQQAEETKTHTVAKGETLWKIAKKYYGDEYLWNKIFAANKIKLSKANSPIIYEGSKILIPSLIEKSDLKLISRSIVDRQTSQEIKSFSALGPKQRPDNWGGSAKYIVGSDAYELISDLTGKEVPYKGGCVAGCSSRNFTTPMQAYADKTGQGYYRENGCRYYEDDSKYSRSSSNFYIDRCAESPNELRSGYRVLEDQIYFFMVVDNEPRKKYQYVDQPVFSPDSNTFAYRAMDERGWFVVKDEKEIGPFDYVQTLLFTKNSDFFYLTQEKNKWILYKNETIIDQQDFIDNLIYTKNANTLAYRTKELNSNNQEVWRVSVVGLGKSQPWDYVDQLFNKSGDQVFFRARDKSGHWFLVLIDNSQETIVFKPQGDDEIYTYYYSPTSNQNEPEIIIMKDKNRELYLYGNNERQRYSNISDIIFDSKGNDFVFRGNLSNQLMGYYVVNGKILKKMYFWGDHIIDSSSEKPMIFRAGFDDDDNFVLYLYEGSSKDIVKEVYSSF